ncbi:MAG: hypothetical protein AB7O48_16380 [Cyclobacteriaceae bacterium]
MTLTVRKKVLFIAWDGPSTSYLESLFAPIFFELKNRGYDFHIIQFSWAKREKIDAISQQCEQMGIPFAHYRVLTKPLLAVGKLITLFTASRKVKQYAQSHKVDVIMPRGLMPARIVLQFAQNDERYKIVYDADGLQIEERVDFAELRVGSFRYRSLKQIERNMTRRADIVLTRTLDGKRILTEQYTDVDESKFHTVSNGRDERIFALPEDKNQRSFRRHLDIPEHALVSVYCGSLAPQYGLPEMARLHQYLIERRSDVYWLVLTGDVEKMQAYAHLPNVIVRSVAAKEVPHFMAIANVGLAFRHATYSMKGVAPIKLGEYLIMGLPVVASGGIGDSEQVLKRYGFCHVMDDFTDETLIGASEWILKIRDQFDSQSIRSAGIEHFGLRRSVDDYDLALKTI